MDAEPRYHEKGNDGRRPENNRAQSSRQEIQKRILLTDRAEEGKYPSVADGDTKREYAA